MADIELCSKGIGIGQPFQHTWREAGSQPNVAYGIVINAAPVHDQLGIILTQAFDFA